MKLSCSGMFAVIILMLNLHSCFQSYKKTIDWLMLEDRSLPHDYTWCLLWLQLINPVICSLLVQIAWRKRFVLITSVNLRSYFVTFYTLPQLSINIYMYVYFRSWLNSCLWLLDYHNGCYVSIVLISYGSSSWDHVC